MSGNVPGSWSPGGHPEPTPLYPQSSLSSFSLPYLQTPNHFPPLTQFSSSHSPCPHFPILPLLPHLLSFNYVHPKALGTKVSNSNSSIFLLNTKQVLTWASVGREGRKGCVLYQRSTNLDGINNFIKQGQAECSWPLWKSPFPSCLVFSPRAILTSSCPPFPLDVLQPSCLPCLGGISAGCTALLVLV